VGERNEHRRGEAAEKGHDDDAAAGEGSEAPLQDAETRVVEEGAHGEAEAEPDQHETG
jgi:hypothetical protein